MTHHEFEEQVVAWVDGELDPAQARRIEDYVAGDVEAARIAAEHRQIAERLRSAEVPVLESAEETLQMVRARLAGSRQLNWRRLALATAAALIVGLAALLWIQSMTTPTPSPDGVPADPVVAGDGDRADDRDSTTEPWSDADLELLAELCSASGDELSLELVDILLEETESEDSRPSTRWADDEAAEQLFDRVLEEELAGENI